jgi:hypothetical protein
MAFGADDRAAAGSFAFHFTPVLVVDRDDVDSNQARADFGERKIDVAHCGLSRLRGRRLDHCGDRHEQQRE